MYRSSPPLSGIFRPFHLLPSAHAPPKPNLEEFLSMESYIDSSDSEFRRAEAGEAAGEEESGGRSPGPSEGTRVDHPKGARMTSQSVGPHRSPASTGKLAYVAIEYFSEFHRIALLKLFCFFKSGGQSTADFSIWG